MKSSQKEYLQKVVFAIMGRLKTYWPVIAAIALLTVELCLFTAMTSGMPNPVILAATFAGDFLVIMLPYLYLPPRRRWSIIIPVWILTVLMSCSIVNYRAFNDILAPMSLFLVGNVNSTVLPSIISLIRPSDFILIFLSGIFTFCIFKYRSTYSVARFSRKVKMLAPAIAVAVFLLSQTVMVWQQCRYFRKSENIDLTFAQSLKLRSNPNIFNHQSDLLNNGILLHTWRAFSQAYSYIHFYRELSDAERDRIEKYLSVMPIQPDSALAANRGKNVVIFLVESLNSYTLETQIDGHELTPNMRRLAEAPGSVAALNVVSQVSHGNSSDGQLLTNTGLFPLSGVTAGQLVGSKNCFVSLPGRLERGASVVIFGEDGKTWNKIPTFANWGFETYTLNDFSAEAGRIGNDGAMIDFAATVLPELKRPFLLEFVTYSTHMPFDTDNLNAPQWLADAPGLENQERRYLITVNYFDTQLGRFIDILKEQNLWDDTILIIASDHSLPLALPSGRKESVPADLPMTFIAANTDTTARIGRTVGQVDIFPTILYLTGYYAPDKYNGLGIPILCDSVRSAFTYSRGIVGYSNSQLNNRHSRAPEISELILRTDYFQTSGR